ncbi:hypothetical protein DSO57_1009062 [Entomophthora muscae]|uniref:Uncharacterized protein n=1 Tax=Entomophthora muscae TaxID=34485 RepID=A0ACC2RLQ2_9FUNG|nr:hypothetical protein DSO57_1009062 [Entomophthora muscae]
MHEKEDLEKELIETEIADFQKIESYGYISGSFKRLGVNHISITLFEGNVLELELSSRGYEVILFCLKNFEIKAAVQCSSMGCLLNLKTIAKLASIKL